MRKLGWLYAVMFFFIAALAYIPGLTDENGVLFGLFTLELHDDLLHLGSGIWAAIAAWLSVRATTLYFKLFGIVYGLDGVVGLITGYGYLDGGIFFPHNHPAPGLMTKIFANLPHIAIGGIAVYIGFVVSRHLADSA
jgi:hypothetical protein